MNVAIITRPITIASASVMGRDHIAFSKNNQDSFASWVSEDHSAGFGIVSDGCGSGKRSEVGAALTSAFLSRRLKENLHLNRGRFTVEQMVTMSLDGLKWSFKSIVDECLYSQPFGEPGEFISTHLLATAVGFCYCDNDGVVFQYGDGIFVLDEEIIETDQDNTPAYPAYELCGGARNVLIRKFVPSQTSKIAVATDGFKKSLFPEVFEHQGKGLQRWMNIRRNSGDFQDDSTIVTACW